MAIADMFLMVHGVTGEAKDPEHMEEIEVQAWSWDMENTRDPLAGKHEGESTMGELHVVKRVDLSSPTLMKFLRQAKIISHATLTVRKAGKDPLEYFKIELEKVRVTSLRTESENAELVEHVKLGFSHVRVVYTPQDDTGGKGGGENIFEADLNVGV